MPMAMFLRFKKADFISAFFYFKVGSANFTYKKTPAHK